MKWSKWLKDDTKGANEKLGLFAIYCWRFGWKQGHRGNKYSTIQLKLASVRWYHRRHRDKVLVTSPSMELLLRGIKRMSDPVLKKQPVTPAFLRLLYRRLDFARPHDSLLWGSVLLGYFFLLRRSEFLRIGSQRTAYCLQTSDAFFSNPEGVRTTYGSASSVTIGLAGSKNDQYGRCAWRTMHVSGDALLCPRQALRHLLLARRALGCGTHPYLCAELKAEEVAQDFKDLAASIGVPKRNYSTHSIRIGGATSLSSGAADSLSIKLLGRWMNDCFGEYPVQTAKSTVGLSSKMVVTN
ncbi:hypothetical protein PF001_g31102 [Phytophthora fragariae]|uniref:Tyr recombinase domain-containing protein n=1 Tax=Phytophthora fragariae TaxID=53985 RepID=A0A6A4B1S4_9STRA|nr:hypothetical protein PF001_g31102 [Phytophthora fragariae]